MTIEWDWNVVNPHFKPLIDNEDRYLILYGGRGSSKSDFAAKRLIERCLSHGHFRCIMIRKVQAKVKDSCYLNIKDLIIEMGLSSLFSFASTPIPKIECKLNGNFFVGAGLDDTSKIKSVKDPTTVWWEEDIPEESDFITITTSIRTLRADFIQEIFTINPEVEGDFKENWFFKRFFAKHYNNGLMSFSDVIKVDLDGEVVDMPYTVHHSTHENNPHLPDAYRALLLDLKRTNPYYYQVYTQGRWGVKMVGGRFYKEFDQGRHTHSDNRYNPDIALHISFDFNVQPYVSVSIWQAVDKEVYAIGEIAAREPDNSTEGACRLFLELYGRHKGGLFVYGDPSGRHEDTRTKAGHNDFNIIRKELKKMYPQVMITKKAPSVVMRGTFINAIFRDEEQGIKISMHEKCTNLINDMLFGKQNGDGEKLKEKAKDKETGIPVEKYHHFSDNMDYFICKMFVNEYNDFKRGESNFDYSVDMGDESVLSAKRFNR